MSSRRPDGAALASGRSTTAIHGFSTSDARSGAVVPPIVQSTTYALESLGRDGGFTYSRAHNPTVTALEEALASLEGLEHATAHGTGMGALTTLCLAVLGSGDRVVCSDVAYGGTVRLLRRVLGGLGVKTTFADTSDPEAVRAAVTPCTRLVLAETPANPTLKLSDLSAIVPVARAAGALLAVDNTFLTAVLQRPAAFGADVVVYSTTKFIEGHGTTVGGALVVRDGGLHERLLEVRKTLGTIQKPFDAWLTLKGIKTLPLRLEAHSRNALAVARWLERQPGVVRVHHPFLESSPQHDLARRQQAAGGGVLSFELEGGAAAAKAFLAGLRVCTLAENLGATETLVTHPATMTHADVPAEQRRAGGIGDGLVRLSVGLEDTDDLVADLERALGAVPHAGAVS